MELFFASIRSTPLAIFNIEHHGQQDLCRVFYSDFGSRIGGNFGTKKVNWMRYRRAGEQTSPHQEAKHRPSTIHLIRSYGFCGCAHTICCSLKDKPPISPIRASDLESSSAASSSQLPYNSTQKSQYSASNLQMSWY